MFKKVILILATFIVNMLLITNFEWVKLWNLVIVDILLILIYNAFYLKWKKEK